MPASMAATINATTTMPAIAPALNPVGAGAGLGPGAAVGPLVLGACVEGEPAVPVPELGMYGGLALLVSFAR